MPSRRARAAHAPWRSGWAASSRTGPASIAAFAAGKPGSMPSVPRLDASRALVIGGARRLGRALALGLAEHGADVAVTSHAAGADAQETAAAIRALGRRSAAVA